MFKAILWDNDGVLVDTEHLYRDATRAIMGRVGFNLSDEHYRQLFLSQNHGAWHMLAEQGHSAAAISDMRAERDDLYSDLLRERNHTIEGVEAVLQSLHGRYAMGVVTSSQRKHFDIIHAQTGLLRYFDFVLAREDYANSKPDPEPYLAGLAKTGFSAGECIAIEDTQRGLMAATGAGIQCVIIPNALTVGGDFRAAYRILRDIRELPGLLGQSTGTLPV